MTTLLRRYRYANTSRLRRETRRRALDSPQRAGSLIASLQELGVKSFKFSTPHF
ncbi:hypothetical protein [Nostoc sp.]|uniref:hypothetical protein n=1 Tax=Nostoc sp. TaxID=1180 RepID=UPI002FFA4481